MSFAAEVRLFIQALQLLTRLPTPEIEPGDPDWLARSAKYFPLVGQVVGAISALVLLIAAKIWSGPIPAILAVAAAVIVTGGFHEDGLADTADGLGGGRDSEHRLAIMKDSRLGAYGALALIFCIALKVAALDRMGETATAALGLIAAHGGGRAAAVAVMARLAYAGDRETAKMAHAAPVSTGELIVALTIALWPMLLIDTRRAVFGALLGSLGALWIAVVARRKIGGYTGDVLGAVEQAFEAGFLLGAALT